MKQNTIYIHPEVDRELVEAIQSYARAERIAFPEAVERAFRDFLKDKTVVDPFEVGDYISTPEVMDILGCAKQTVYNLMKKGILTPIKSGKNYYFERESIIAYRDSHITTRGQGYDNRNNE